jgi:biotin carboxyl carrier protein
VKYVVSVNGERRTVAVDPDGVEVDGRRVSASAAEVEGTPVRSVTIGDAVYRVVVRRQDGRGRYQLWIDGFAYEVEALDERARAIRDLSSAATKPTGPAALLAPMPGLVVRVSVEVGDAVHVGQRLVVMEAMKMENELRAPAAGRVKAVLVSAGAAVEKGATLVELE